MSAKPAGILSLCILLSIALMAAETPKLVQNLTAGKKQHVVTYGTSLTAGGAWVGQLKSLLEKKYPGLATVTNSGQSAMWSDWGVKNLDKRVIEKAPDAVFIEFAINDAFLEYKTSTADCRKNLENMIDRILKARPECQVILMTMNPPINVHLERRPKIEEYYQVYRDVAAERKLLLIDHYPVWKALLDKDKKTFDAWVPDGIHPSATGCEKVIIPGIEAALFGGTGK
ncbi:MAG TPA: SGNH/GDSL hydrolase family protein [Planctomycetota bacterium]|jgi:lysophospholipase L1-like esterase